MSKCKKDKRETNASSSSNTPNNQSSSSNSKDNFDSTSSNEKPQPTRSEFTLCVKNLPFELEKEDLETIFKEFHPISARVITRKNGRSKGYGFIQFGNAKDQTSALESLDQSEVNGRIISISIMKEKTSQEFN